MQQRRLATPTAITAILILQSIPLLLFPPEVFSAKTQQWWLPALLVVMVVLADVELIARRSLNLWPWYLISFAQGFNIISRLMMMWAHATNTVGQVYHFNALYVVLTLVAMAMSAFLLWYTELPDVRMGLARG